MKGDGKTRLLGFGLPTPTFEIEEQLPGRIRNAFAAARKHQMAVMLHFDFHLAWKKRPDVWNWFDPGKPGYDPQNKYNVEWHGWDGPPNRVHYFQETVAFWCEQFVAAGIPAEKLYPHIAAPATIEVMNAPIWTAFNKYSRPGWTAYAIELLGQSFKPIYDELEKHGNPVWAGVEANAGIPGSLVDWETYLGWHYNHGCVLVGVNMGATGTDLPRRLQESAFGKEAIAAYRKFLAGQPLVEKPVSTDRTEFRIQIKMRRVRNGIERWFKSGKDPRSVGKLMEGAKPLADKGKLDELEKLVDQALEMLGEREKVPDVYLHKSE
jgi:hypothetical protein